MAISTGNNNLSILKCFFKMPDIIFYFKKHAVHHTVPNSFFCRTPHSSIVFIRRDIRQTGCISVSYTHLSNALEALKINPNNGQALLLIGKAYAFYSPSYGADAFDHASVFWAAVDKFARAKQVDPSVAEEADKLISTYSPHFPNKEEAFFRSVTEDVYKRQGFDGLYRFLSGSGMGT